uniref:Olfactomedin 2 n=1 Tax=Oryzias sinensis TaxID=183150 RepID=A0A8C8DV06_9TELE
MIILLSPPLFNIPLSSSFLSRAEEGWQVYSTASDPDGRCVCTVVAPARNLCKRDPRIRQLRSLTEQVQNVSQSMEVVDLRTSRDLQYVQDSEPLLRGVDGRLHTYNTLNLPKNGILINKIPLGTLLQQIKNMISVDLLHFGRKGALERYSGRCGRLTAVSNPITVRASGSRFGSWMTDAMIPSSDSRVWSMDGYYKGRRVLEYRTMGDFTKGQNFVQHLLPHPWAGTGHVVYNGSLYYNKHQSNILVQYSFHSRSVLLQRSLSGAGYNNTFPYSWGGSSDIDLMVDEIGLWAVYTSIPNAGNIMVSRLDPRSLDVLQSWDTGFPKRSAGEAFMICGTLYVTNSHLAGAKVHFAYHTNTSTYEYTDIPFHNQYSHISMMDYNPRERALYTWNNGHQVLYNVTLFHVIRSDG